MTPNERAVVQEWNIYNRTYDLISGVVQPANDGCNVAFTRYVMKDDYLPRVEKLDLFFSYRKQPIYRFFDDDVWIVGFYRNSVGDLDPNEFGAPMSSSAQ